MSLSADLLTQAQHLADLDRGRPKQANLRRAISSAYYSLFHLFVAESVQRLSPATPLLLASRVARAYVHEEMKQVCKSIAEGVPSPILLELQPAGFSAELRLATRVFIELQAARHQADYDVSATYTRFEAQKLLDRVEVGVRAWKVVRRQDEATVFLTALLLARKWAR